MKKIFKKLKEVTSGYYTGPIFYAVLIIGVLTIVVLGITAGIRGCDSTNEPAVATLEKNLDEVTESITGAQSTATAIGRGVKQGARLVRTAKFALQGAGTRLQQARSAARSIERTSNDLSDLIAEIEKNNQHAK